MLQLLRDKFTELLIFVALVAIFTLWAENDFRNDLSYYVFGLFSAFLTSVGMRPRPNDVKADTITAEHIETARTQSGDIISPNIITNKEQDQ
jgi:hypothetical protein